MRSATEGDGSTAEPGGRWETRSWAPWEAASRARSKALASAARLTGFITYETMPSSRNCVPPVRCPGEFSIRTTLESANSAELRIRWARAKPSIAFASFAQNGRQDQESRNYNFASTESLI